MEWPEGEEEGEGETARENETMSMCVYTWKRMISPGNGSTWSDTLVRGDTRPVFCLFYNSRVRKSREGKRVVGFTFMLVRQIGDLIGTHLIWLVSFGICK